MVGRTLWIFRPVGHVLERRGFSVTSQQMAHTLLRDDASDDGIFTVSDAFFLNTTSMNPMMRKFLSDDPLRKSL